jgi:hypothetical protein
LPPTRILRIFFPEAWRGEASRIGFYLTDRYQRINPFLEGAESKYESMMRQVLVVWACHSCHVPRERQRERGSCPEREREREREREVYWQSHEWLKRQRERGRNLIDNQEVTEVTEGGWEGGRERHTHRESSLLTIK